MRASAARRQPSGGRPRSPLGSPRPCGGERAPKAWISAAEASDYFATVDQEYVAAVAEAADTALASGQPLRILALLRQVAVGESLNEALQARLMLMLAVTGQQALALAHYKAVRERLIDELGVDPGAEMRAAYNRVLRQELPVAAATNVADPLARPRSARARRRQAVLSCSPHGAPSPLVPPAQLLADLPIVRRSRIGVVAAVGTHAQPRRRISRGRHLRDRRHGGHRKDDLCHSLGPSHSEALHGRPAVYLTCAASTRADPPLRRWTRCRLCSTRWGCQPVTYPTVSMLGPACTGVS